MDGSLYDLYEKDFYAWTQKQAARLRARKLSEIDIAGLLDDNPACGLGWMWPWMPRIARRCC
ncbi:hypothetical protein IP70_21850 [alpha proteobacterium AAP38]|nr:hypothetical protein IP70_21850 [alpha proteobacterium AAP38]